MLNVFIHKLFSFGIHGGNLPNLALSTKTGRRKSLVILYVTFAGVYNQQRELFDEMVATDKESVTLIFSS